MGHPATSTDFSLDASDVRGHQFELEAEGAMALGEGLGRVGASVSGLDGDAVRGHSLYVAAAVTETLRREHFGPHAGSRARPAK